VNSAVNAPADEARTETSKPVGTFVLAILAPFGSIALMASPLILDAALRVIR
jgi:hypothetical protein